MQLRYEMILEARQRLKDVARKTPLERARKIGPNVYIKSENLQMTGAFKIRGAYNKISCLTPEEAAHGVVACSAGNHAQGVAYSATLRGIRSVICMPQDAPLMKVEATRNYGAEVILVPGVYDDAQAEARRLSEEQGYTFAHPFDDPFVMAGQGTIGLEILEQLPDVEQILVPIGGGGLISGIAMAVKTLRPDVKVIGVQSENIPAAANSFKCGRVVTCNNRPTIADGIHVLTPGTQTFEIIETYVDDIVTVSEDDIAAAITTLMEDQKTVAEGAAATPVAAYMYEKVDTSRKTVCVVSGGNVDITSLQRIITRGLYHLGRMVTMEVKVNDNAGALAKLLKIIGEEGANVVSIEHHRGDEASEVTATAVSITLETIDHAHIARLKQRVQEKGYQLLREKETV